MRTEERQQKIGKVIWRELQYIYPRTQEESLAGAKIEVFQALSEIFTNDDSTLQDLKTFIQNRVQSFSQRQHHNAESARMEYEDLMLVLEDTHQRIRERREYLQHIDDIELRQPIGLRFENARQIANKIEAIDVPFLQKVSKVSGTLLQLEQSISIIIQGLHMLQQGDFQGFAGLTGAAVPGLSANTGCFSFLAGPVGILMANVNMFDAFSQWQRQDKPIHLLEQVNVQITTVEEAISNLHKDMQDCFDATWQILDPMQRSNCKLFEIVMLNIETVLNMLKKTNTIKQDREALNHTIQAGLQQLLNQLIQNYQDAVSAIHSEFYKRFQEAQVQVASVHPGFSLDKAISLPVVQSDIDVSQWHLIEEENVEHQKTIDVMSGRVPCVGFLEWQEKWRNFFAQEKWHDVLNQEIIERIMQFDGVFFQKLRQLLTHPHSVLMQAQGTMSVTYRQNFSNGILGPEINFELYLNQRNKSSIKLCSGSPSLMWFFSDNDITPYIDEYSLCLMSSLQGASDNPNAGIEKNKVYIDPETRMYKVLRGDGEICKGRLSEDNFPFLILIGINPNDLNDPNLKYQILHYTANAGHTRGKKWHVGGFGSQCFTKDLDKFVGIDDLIATFDLALRVETMQEQRRSLVQAHDYEGLFNNLDRRYLELMNVLSILDPRYSSKMNVIKNEIIDAFKTLYETGSTIALAEVRQMLDKALQTLPGVLSVLNDEGEKAKLLQTLLQAERLRNLEGGFDFVNKGLLQYLHNDLPQWIDRRVVIQQAEAECKAWLEEEKERQANLEHERLEIERQQQAHMQVLLEDIMDLQNRIAIMEGNINICQEEIIQLKTEIVRCEQTIIGLQREIEENRRGQNAVQENIRNWQDLVLDGDALSHREDALMTPEVVQALRDALTAEEVDLANLIAALEAKEEELTTLNLHLADEMEKLASANTRLEGFCVRRDNLQEEEAAKKKLLMDLEAIGKPQIVLPVAGAMQQFGFFAHANIPVINIGQQIALPGLGHGS
jgi:hypothetical protein